MDVPFTQEECCNCHVPFAMTTALRVALLESRATFYCPNGHGQHFTGESDSQKLSRARLEASDLRAERDRLQKKLDACLKPKRKRRK